MQKFTLLTFAAFVLFIQMSPAFADNLCGQGQYGKYEIVDSTLKLVCRPCNLSCLDCQNSADYCTKCKDYNYLDTSSHTCQACIENCQTCINNNQCEVCGPGFNLNSNKQCVAVQCPDGQYYDLSFNQCEPCSEQVAQCLECNQPTVDQFVCTSCESGFYVTINTCQACPDGCATCTSKASCQSCTDGYVLVNDQCQVQQCPEGQYYDFTQSQCEPCNTQVQNCYTCTETSSTNFQCASCESGFYLDLNACPACVEPCATCTNSTDCLTCISGYDFDPNTNTCVMSQCQSGQYFDFTQNKCEPCNFKVSYCATCTETTTTNYACTSCQNGHYFSNGTCPTCQANCQICTNGSDCQQCAPGYSLNNNICTLITCNSNFYFDYNQLQCVSCASQDTGCDKCSMNPVNKAFTCTACLTNYYIPNGQSKCIPLPPCPEHSTFDYNTDKCVTCQDVTNNCLECAWNPADKLPECTKCKDLHHLNKHHKCIVGTLKAMEEIFI